MEDWQDGQHHPDLVWYMSAKVNAISSVACSGQRYAAIFPQNNAVFGPSNLR